MHYHGCSDRARQGLALQIVQQVAPGKTNQPPRLRGCLPGQRLCSSHQRQQEGSQNGAPCRAPCRAPMQPSPPSPRPARHAHRPAAGARLVAAGRPRCGPGRLGLRAVLTALEPDACACGVRRLRSHPNFAPPGLPAASPNQPYHQYTLLHCPAENALPESLLDMLPRPGAELAARVHPSGALSTRASSGIAPQRAAMAASHPPTPAPPPSRTTMRPRQSSWSSCLRP